MNDNSYEAKGGAALVDDLLAVADEIEAQAHAWAVALEKLGERRAALFRRRAYELSLKLPSREASDDPALANDAAPKEARQEPLAAPSTDPTAVAAPGILTFLPSCGAVTAAARNVW